MFGVWGTNSNNGEILDGISGADLGTEVYQCVYIYIYIYNTHTVCYNYVELSEKNSTESESALSFRFMLPPSREPRHLKTFLSLASDTWDYVTGEPTAYSRFGPT